MENLKYTTRYTFGQIVEHNLKIKTNKIHIYIYIYLFMMKNNGVTNNSCICVQHHMYVLIFLLTNVSQKIDAL